MHHFNLITFSLDVLFLPASPSVSFTSKFYCKLHTNWIDVFSLLFCVATFNRRQLEYTCNPVQPFFPLFFSCHLPSKSLKPSVICVFFVSIYFLPHPPSLPLSFLLPPIHLPFPSDLHVFPNLLRGNFSCAVISSTPERLYYKSSAFHLFFFFLQVSLR